MAWPEPPLPRSIFGWDPKDEFAVIVADWIWQQAGAHKNVEIEAKLGTLIDSATGARIELPVVNETIVHVQHGWRFESSMQEAPYRQFNQILNSLVEAKRISYQRIREIDYIHRGNIRVTRDTDSLQTKPGGIIRKQRIADMNVYCPNHAFDFRISINTETPLDTEPMDEPELHREKNRVSYADSLVKVDLTHVQQPNKSREQLYELEVEFVDAMSILQQAAAAHAQPTQEWTPYEDLILIFLNNVRMLIRQVS